jgi:hypothetical protein
VSNYPLVSVLHELGYSASKVDPAVFERHTSVGTVMLHTHVDDCTGTGGRGSSDRNCCAAHTTQAGCWCQSRSNGHDHSATRIAFNRKHMMRLRVSVCPHVLPGNQTTITAGVHILELFVAIVQWLSCRALLNEWLYSSSSHSQHPLFTTQTVPSPKF